MKVFLWLHRCRAPSVQHSKQSTTTWRPALMVAVRLVPPQHLLQSVHRDWRNVAAATSRRARPKSDDRTTIDSAVSMRIKSLYCCIRHFIYLIVAVVSYWLDWLRQNAHTTLDVFQSFLWRSTACTHRLACNLVDEFNYCCHTTALLVVCNVLRSKNISPDSRVSILTVWCSGPLYVDAVPWVLRTSSVL